MKKNIIIFDKQDITHIGIKTLIKQRYGTAGFISVDKKDALISALVASENSLIVLDYTLSDLNSVDGLLNISARFPNAHWLLFSEELSFQFLKRVTADNQSFSILLKTAGLKEIDVAIAQSYANKQFICMQVANLLLMGKGSGENKGNNILTATEQEILKGIAQGKTTKEIAADRNLSFHTVTTHRKNIFRKLDVNNVYEATKYALRAGIIDSADYYI